MRRRITERQTRKKHALLRKTKTQRNAQKSASTCRTPLSSPLHSPVASCSAPFAFRFFTAQLTCSLQSNLLTMRLACKKAHELSPPPPFPLPLVCLLAGHRAIEGGQRLPLWAAPSCSFLRFCILRPTLRPRTALPSSNMNNMNTNNNNMGNNNSNKENKHNNNQNENNNNRASPIAAHRSCSCFWSARCLLIFLLSCTPLPSLSLLFSLPVLFSFFALLFLSACLFGQHVNL